MTPAVNDYMYKQYRQHMKQYLPGQDIMPRRIFTMLMTGADTVDEGRVVLERYFELLIAQLLEGNQASGDPNDTSDTGESLRSDSDENSTAE